MSGIDWVPGLSQVKSITQLAMGDKEGAKRTAENFGRECPVVSQVTSTVQVLAGDVKGAKETQNRFVDNVDNVFNGRRDRR